MKKTNVMAAAVLACALGGAALAGCSGAAETGPAYNPGEPPLMTASHEGRFERLGAKGCYGCQGVNGAGEPMLAAASPLPADHYAGGDTASREIDGPRTECLTCHPVAQE